MALSLNAAEGVGVQRPRVTFEDYVSRVGEKHPEIQIAQDDVKNLESMEDTSGRWPNPRLEFGREQADIRSLRGKNSMSAEPIDNGYWVYGISQEIPWPGTLSKERTAAAAATQSARIQTELAAKARQLDAADFFVDMVALHKLLIIKQESLKELSAILALTDIRNRQGLGGHADVFQAKLDFELLKNAIISDEADVQIKKRRAALWAGLGPEDSYDFVFEWPKGLTELQIEEALKAHPLRAEDLGAKMVQADLDRKIAAVEAARARHYPSFMTTVEVMPRSGGMYMFNAMLGIQVPVSAATTRGAFNNSEGYSKSANARESAWYGERRDLALSQTRARLELAISNVKAIRSKLLPLATEHLAARRSDFSLGQANLTDLNEARQRLLDIQAAHVLSTAAMARECINLDRIAAGLADSALDLPVPQITVGTTSSRSMGANSGMGGQTGKSMSPGGMKQPGKNGSKQQPGTEAQPNNMPEDTGSKAGGMKM